MASRASRLFSRARAIDAARRLAVGALHRIAREVDRLSMAFEPSLPPLPLRDRERRGHGSPRDSEHAEEIEVVAAAAAELHPPPPAPTNEPSASATLGLAQVDHLRARLEPRLAVLRRGARWEQADNPADALRQLRIATRRLRAFVLLFAPMLGDAQAKPLRRRLKALTRAIGPLRQWDELLEGLHAEHETAAPLPRAALEHVIAWAEARRAKALPKTRRALAKLETAALADALDGELDRICGRLFRLDARLPQHAWTLLEPVLERTFVDLPTFEDESDVEALHEIRTRAKGLRYALELLKPALGGAYAELRGPAKAIQGGLGAHHARALMAEVLGERARELEKRGLKTLADALTSLGDDMIIQRKESYVSVQSVLVRFRASLYVDTTKTALAREL